MIQGINEEDEDDVSEDQRNILYMEKRMCVLRLAVAR